MFIINLLKNLNNPYSDMVKKDFRPLEYIEIMRDKPLIIKLNDKYSFKCTLDTIDDFIKFNDSKNIIFGNLDKLNQLGQKEQNTQPVKYSKILNYKLLIRLLYEISKNRYKGRIRKYFYEKFLNEYLYNNFEVLLKIIQHLIDYNTMLKKKQEFIQNIDIYNNVYSDMTIGGRALKELIRVDPVTGEKYFIH